VHVDRSASPKRDDLFNGSSVYSWAINCGAYCEYYGCVYEPVGIPRRFLRTVRVRRHRIHRRVLHA
jgi:hypothetical protein